MGTPAKPQKRLMDNLRGALRLAWDASPRTFVQTTSMVVVAAVIPPIVLWLGKVLIDRIARAQIDQLTLKDAMPIVITLGVLTVVQRILTYFQATRQELFSWRVRFNAERRFLEQAARVDLGNFDNSDWHDRMARAKRDVHWRPFQLSWTVIGLSGTVISMTGMLGILLSLHPLLVVLSLASVVPGVLIRRRINKLMYDFWWTTTPDDREKGYMSDLLTDPKSAKEVRAFTLARHFQSRFETIDARQYQKMERLYRLSERYAAVSAVIAGAALAAAYAFVASRGFAGELSAGDLAAVIGAFAAVTQQVSLLSESFVALDQHATFLDDYFTFLGLGPLLPVTDPATPLPAKLDDGIRFENVTFSYPGGTEPALAGLDLHIRPGELMALVGDNGAGKTSLVKLLLRFYDAQQGAVRVGGVDVREVDPMELRARIGILFQDFTQYELSARENVTLGRVDTNGHDKNHDDDQVWGALHAARGADIVKGLRDGLDSKVGRLFEGGHDLSGGEWQRLALARLVYRGADVWILDEPTSALDAEAEAAIFSELREQLHGRIGIVISHRFSTVRVADRIAVVADGRVTELGTHEELLARRGRYAQLFELQAAGYR